MEYAAEGSIAPLVGIVMAILNLFIVRLTAAIV